MLPPRIPRLAAVVLLTLAGTLGPAPPARSDTRVQTESRPQWGLRTSTFDTLQGTVTVHLPNDAAAGDTLSGTVSVEPAGERRREVRRNTDELSGHVVDVAGTEAPAGEGRIEWTVPADLAGDLARLVLRDRSGREVATAEIPVSRRPAIPARDYELPPIAQAGRPLPISGAFDGDLTTTGVSVGGQAAEVLAESPRQVVARTPTGATGPTEVTVSEGGSLVASGTVNVVGLALDAPRLHLQRGERTSVTVEVRGLQDLPPSAFPVHLELVNRSPRVVRLVEVEGQRLVETLGRGNVGPDGTFRRTLPLAGVAVGSYAITAFVFADWPMDPELAEVPYPGMDPITCALGGDGDEDEGDDDKEGDRGDERSEENGEEPAEEEVASGAGYDFVKEGLSPLDQHHRPEWGERWCAPTATATSLAWFAANGFPALVHDSGGDGVDEADLYRLVERLAELSHTTAEAGTFPHDWLSGLHRYLAEHGLDDDFDVKVFEAGDDPAEEIDNVVGRFRGKEEEVREKVRKLGEAIETKRREIGEKEERLEILKAREQELREARMGTEGEERERLDKELRKVSDDVWDLESEIESDRETLARLLFNRSQWQTLLDQLDHWDAMKRTHRYYPVAPDFANYSNELEAGEDVILRIALPIGTHVLVGQAFEKDPDDEGTWKAALVDPDRGAAVDTRLREQGGALEVFYRGAWRKVVTLLSVSPKEE